MAPSPPSSGPASGTRSKSKSPGGVAKLTSGYKVAKPASKGKTTYSVKAEGEPASDKFIEPHDLFDGEYYYSIEKTVIPRHKRKNKPFEEEKVVIQRTKPKKEEKMDWMVRRYIGQDQIKPGDIIFATLACANFVKGEDIDYPHENIRIFGGNIGPVWAKRRFMVVLFHHSEAMVCAPLFSQGQGLAKLSKERRSELASITHRHNKAWEGNTHHNGPPLLMEAGAGTTGLKLYGYVDVAQPVCIQRSEDVQYNMGKLTKGSYLRLLEMFRFVQERNLGIAYSLQGVKYMPDVPSGPDAQQARLGKLGLTKAEQKEELRLG